jgi:hypothetical protein
MYGTHTLAFQRIFVRMKIISLIFIRFSYVSLVRNSVTGPLIYCILMEQLSMLRAPWKIAFFVSIATGLRHQTVFGFFPLVRGRKLILLQPSMSGFIVSNTRVFVTFVLRTELHLADAILYQHKLCINVLIMSIRR